MKRRFSSSGFRSALWARCALFLCPALVLIGLGAGCKSRENSDPSATVSETELVVFAAASLQEAFSVLGKDFEKTHRRVKVVFNFVGTQELRTQVERGATMDVFASADQKHMRVLAEAKLVTASTVFARNEPVLVVSKETMGKVQSLSELPKLTRIVLGSVDVPIGRYSVKILDNVSKTLGADFRSQVEAKVVSRELSVRQVLAKVRLGEAEAGIVYRTDTTNGVGEVGVITIADEVNVIAEYPIAVAIKPAHPDLAKAWMTLVLSDAGQAVLRKAGFLAPKGRTP